MMKPEADDNLKDSTMLSPENDSGEISQESSALVEEDPSFIDEQESFSMMEVDEEAVEAGENPDEYIPGVHILADEDGITVEGEDGKLELGEVKEIIIRAFKEEESEDDFDFYDDEESVKGPRIFMRDDKIEEDGEIQEETVAAAVRVLEEERKAIKDETGKVIESTSEDEIAENIEEHSREKGGINKAEIIMVGDADHALALSYTPGDIPRVVAKGKKKKAHKLLEDAFKLDIPVVEVINWNYHKFDELNEGEEIPDSMFPTAAKALGLVYRLKSDAHLVRYVKPLKKTVTKGMKKAKQRIKELEKPLSFAGLSLDVNEYLYQLNDDLNTQLELTASRLSAELGLPVPRIEIKKVSSLENGEYVLKLKEVEYCTGILDLNFAPPDLFYPLQSKFRTMVYDLGHELLGYAEVEMLIDNLRKTNPSLVKFLMPEHLSSGALRFILKGLLREKIPIKDMNTILETIEENIAYTVDPELLVEYIRSAFARFISRAYMDKSGNLNVLLLSAKVERKIGESIRESPNMRWLDLKDGDILRFLTNLGMELSKIQDLEIPVVILTSPMIRRFIRKVTETSFPEIPVLSYSEISPMTPVKTVGVVKIDKE